MCSQALSDPDACVDLPFAPMARIVAEVLDALRRVQEAGL